MIVMKFGGSSLANAACFRQVRCLVQRSLSRSPLVVLSAAGDSTDRLDSAARRAAAGDLSGALEEVERVLTLHRHIVDEFRKEDPPEEGGALAPALESAGILLEALLTEVAGHKELTVKALDSILSFGELLSTKLFAEISGARWLDAREVIRTDARFGRARPNLESLTRQAEKYLAPALRKGVAVVTQGFIGRTEDGHTTTLGRGGSDYTASLLGAALGASEVEIWTDVEGIFTCDPRVVPEARSLSHLTFAEAAELAAFGARVLHPATLQPLVEKAIPLTVRHTQKPDGASTRISSSGPSQVGRWALAGRGPVTVLTVTSPRMLHRSGFLARLFEIFGRHEVSVDLVATAEVSVSLTVEDGAPLSALVEEISSFATVETHPGRALVAVVGAGLRQTPGFAGRIFGSLTSVNVEMVSMGASDINLSLIVRQEQMKETLERLHSTLSGSPKASELRREPAEPVWAGSPA